MTQWIELHIDAIDLSRLMEELNDSRGASPGNSASIPPQNWKLAPFQYRFASKYERVPSEVGMNSTELRVATPPKRIP